MFHTVRGLSLTESTEMYLWNICGICTASFPIVAGGLYFHRSFYKATIETGLLSEVCIGGNVVFHIVCMYNK